MNYEDEQHYKRLIELYIIPRYLTVEQAAEIAGNIPSRSILYMIENGAIETRKSRKKEYSIKTLSLLDFLEEADNYFFMGRDIERKRYLIELKQGIKNPSAPQEIDIFP